MKKLHVIAGGISCACILASGSAAWAEEDERASYEIELEIGVDSVVKSDVAANELTNVYGTAEVTLSYALTDRVSAFGGLMLENVTGITGNRAFEDMGLYVAELGLSFDLGKAEVSIGKIHPAFGYVWDAAPGFYGTSYAEDYELAEMLGAMVAFELGQGTLTAAAFYADNTALSESLGTNRGRNSTAAGGAGNTGKLNNIALQYDAEFGATTFHAGARYLTAGIGDAKDETGFSLGISQAINDNVELVAEVAHFTGWGGSTDDASYGTLGLSYNQGPITYSATVQHREITSTGTDNLFTLGLDYEFANGNTLTAGYGFAKEGGVASQMLGVAMVIPIGG
ncbi:hypothetical protein U5922_002040 [Aquicoccus sp. G2-2]|uniref:hypothetical protein n=1 Tax=Aquicoccus sp. G2-2 TaxID=3092120 RepID=UPI002AE06547|nr:hypothetical protein [Aquicoccus sp. G2-2]MEA1112309.1 hypothetical protein [Aquicoccus sp. G2-2]